MSNCDHPAGICKDTAHQGIGGAADRDWFAEQHRRVAENRRRQQEYDEDIAIGQAAALSAHASDGAA